ncbi:hypothetical protein CYY_000792 [Polysphondylium violaceum]|uniref:Thioredoxin domain-containing protein n=1 Tax=Polysphondylium violaceum TaxID=133409 RepID=A0A8J4Q304_9MYCE|nr:hypothetical protein CYY_000792 [Polysphondylium violaceum]
MKLLFVSLVFLILASTLITALHEAEGSVELTTENLEQIVFDPSKYVLIHLYAPWSGHCKFLSKSWGPLAQSLKDNEQVVISRFNCVDNLEFCESKFGHIMGYPTIYFVDKSNQFERYDGPRNVEDMTRFILDRIKESTSNKRPQDEL